MEPESAKHTRRSQYHQANVFIFLDFAERFGPSNEIVTGKEFFRPAAALRESGGQTPRQGSLLLVVKNHYFAAFRRLEIMIQYVRSRPPPEFL